jgi:2-desacetyl-2-hydroxyethyl bacteriochlorophyllide A dehydrogenase
VKAALYRGVRDIVLEERPAPVAGPGEAVVRIEYCGICGSDLHIYFEGILPPGIVLGHENVGTVTEVGPGVEGLRVGDRVAAGPPGPCGHCYYCLHGLPSICVEGFEKTNGLRRDGGMAEYMLLQDARQMLFPIPEEVSFEDAVLLDTMATAYRGLTQSAFRLGDNAVVSGAGPIGLCVVQFLRLGGARHITVLEIVPERRRLAAQMGADLVLDPASGNDMTALVSELYGGVGADVVVESAGVPQSLELCLTLVRAGGQVLNLGVTEKPATLVPAFLVLRELDIKSSLAYGAEELQKCLHFLATGRFSTKGLLSDIIPLDDLVESGFNRLARDKTLIKVAVAPMATPE